MTGLMCPNLSHDFLATPSGSAEYQASTRYQTNLFHNFWLVPTCWAGEEISAMRVRDQNKCGLATITLRDTQEVFVNPNNPINLLRSKTYCMHHHLTLYSPVVTICTTSFNIQQFYVLPTEYIYHHHHHREIFLCE